MKIKNKYSILIKYFILDNIILDDKINLFVILIF